MAAGTLIARIIDLARSAGIGSEAKHQSDAHRAVIAARKQREECEESATKAVEWSKKASSRQAEIRAEIEAEMAQLQPGEAVRHG